jgi:hypothetical protein
MALLPQPSFLAPRTLRPRSCAIALILPLLLLFGDIRNASADHNVHVWAAGADERNLLGGRWAAFSTPSCHVSATTVSDVNRLPGEKAISIHARQQGTKPCGLWMHLFNDSVSPKVADIPRTDGYLIFWVKGAHGGEDFSIAMADLGLFERDDTHLAGSIGKYLKVGVTTQWQRVVIALSDFGLNGMPVSFAILFRDHGEQLMWIDDIELSGKPDIGPAMPRSKAIWIWNTEELLRNPVSRRNMFAFARDQGIDQIFLQVLYTVADHQEWPTITISNQAALRRLLAEASDDSIRVHALDGDPEFVLQKNHARVLSLMSAILDFNRSSPSRERFYGIHLDNEPYLLIGFDGPQRDSILRQFIELNEQVMRFLRESRQSIVFGVDVPFWFADIAATPNNSDASGDGTKSLTDRILDVVDNVCIMDYRTTANGPNGIIEHARSAVYHANRVAKKVFIGVETFREQATPVHFLYGVTEDDWNILARDNAPLMLSSRLDGFPLRIFNDGLRHNVGVAEPRQAPSRPLNDVLAEIYSTYGATVDGRQADLTRLMIHAQEALSRSSEFSGFKPFIVGGGHSLVAGFLTTERMAASTSFDGHRRAQMDETLGEVVHYFDKDPGFAGIAIDDYEHLRMLRP